MKPSFSAFFSFFLLSTKISLHYCTEPTADGFLQTDDQPKHHPQAYHHSHRQFLRESSHISTDDIQAQKQNRLTVLNSQTASPPIPIALSKSEEVLQYYIYYYFYYFYLFIINTMNFCKGIYKRCWCFKSRRSTT
jgi:hypothetical protein